MFFFAVSVVLSSVLLLCEGEIIKLENKTHILCVTNYDGDNIAMYVDPPVVEHGKNNSILIEDDRFWNDWLLKNSKDVIVPMVGDKRFENFETIYTNGIYFPYVVNLDYSTTCTSLRTSTYDPDPISKKTKRDIKIVGWRHASQHVVVNETDINNFHPFKIEITAKKSCYWKVHDYNLRWAESSSETATIIPISPDDMPCVVLYTYLCPYCILKLRIGRSQISLQGSNKKEWISRKFSVNLQTNLTIYRSTTRTDTIVGQWAIDIRQCPPTKSGKTIYGVSLEKDVESGANRTCKFTSFVHINREERSNPDIFSCSRGLIGRACDISCKELLSSDLRYCQKHQICDDTLSNSNCFCAWGYRGSACDEECDSGSAGLSCLKH